MDSKYENHEFKGAEEDVGRAGSVGNEYNLAEGGNQLERGLKSRHIQFLALGTQRFEHSPFHLALSLFPASVLSIHPAM